MEPPEQGGDTPSIAAAVQTRYGFITCSVYAGWRPAEVYLQAGPAANLHSNLTKPIQSLIDWFSFADTSDDFQKLSVDLDWARESFPLEEILPSVLRGLQSTGEPSNGQVMDRFGAEVSILLTDGLARIGAGAQLYTPTQGHSGTEVRFEVYQYGFSYSTRGITRHLALGILLTHMAIAFIHSIVTACDGWRCYSLRSMYEILVLAVNSPPTRILENTCAGIEKLATYQLMAKVREVTDGHLALVFADDQGDYGSLVKPEDGRLYGCLYPERASSAKSEEGRLEAHLKME